jgi:CheY-like chemotaxis protein
MKILLIDDDADDQTLFCEAVKLIEPQIQCDIAANGREGLMLLSSYTILPHLVFLDINMPIMDGRETLRIIKSTPRLQKLDVIVYSTSNHLEEVKQFTRFGVRFVTKPNSFDELVDLLRIPILEASVVSQEQLS